MPINDCGTIYKFIRTAKPHPHCFKTLTKFTAGEGTFLLNSKEQLNKNVRCI
jgi:hypothetical protein